MLETILSLLSIFFDTRAINTPATFFTKRHKVVGRRTFREQTTFA